MPKIENQVIRYHLYRLKFIQPNQAVIFSDNLTSSEIMLKAIEERPEKKLAKNSFWKIGNVENFVADNFLYFEVGRTVNSKLPKFDEEKKDFVDELSDLSPHTECIILSDLNVIAIATNSLLSPTTRNVSSRLSDLLKLTDIVIRNSITVEIDPIPDPNDFIEMIDAVYALYSFTASFRGPNPIDADALFQKPLARIASVASASGGQVKLNGKDLDRDCIKAITRSTAATGNMASAKVKDEENSPPRTIKLSELPLEVVVRKEDYSLSRVALDIRNRYKEVRDV